MKVNTELCSQRVERHKFVFPGGDSLRKPRAGSCQQQSRYSVGSQGLEELDRKPKKLAFSGAKIGSRFQSKKIKIKIRVEGGGESLWEWRMAGSREPPKLCNSDRGATLTAAPSECLRTWDPVRGWAATRLRAAPPPSPAVSSRSPSPFPHMWVTSKFREKAAWWLPNQRRGSVAPLSPPGGAPGRNQDPRRRRPDALPLPAQILLANSLLKSKCVSRAIFGRVRRVLKLNQTGRRGSLGL